MIDIVEDGTTMLNMRIIQQNNNRKTKTNE